MKKIIMIALAALTISESTVYSTTLTAISRKAPTYRVNGGDMIAGGTTYLNSQEERAFFINQASKFYMLTDNDGTSYTKDNSNYTTYDAGVSRSGNAETFRNALEKDSAYDDQTAFNGYWGLIPIDGSVSNIKALYHLEASFANAAAGAIVNNITRIATRMLDPMENCNVYFSSYDPIYAKSKTATEFLTAAKADTVSLSPASSYSAGSFNTVFSTATTTNATTKTTSYWTNCVVCSSSPTTTGALTQSIYTTNSDGTQTSTTYTYLGSYDLANGTTRYVYGLTATSSDYTEANGSLDGILIA